MTPTQKLALTKVVDSQEKLQEAFNHPKAFKLSDSSSLVAHVVTFVAHHQDGLLVWSSAIRVFNPRKKKYKSISAWSAYERLKVEMMLTSELQGVGVDGTDVNFQTTSINCAHIQRALTGQEMSMTLLDADAILGKKDENGAPAVIRDKGEANKLLGKIQRELEN